MNWKRNCHILELNAWVLRSCKLPNVNRKADKMSCHAFWLLFSSIFFFFCLTEVVNFPLFTSQDIISKYHSQNGNFDFNKYISIQWRRWCYRFVLSISPCIVYSITRRVEIDSLGVRYFIRRPKGNSLAKGWERRMASLRILGYFRFVI